MVCWNPVCSGLRRHERRRREHGHRSTRSKRPLLGPRVKPVHGKDSQENSHETQSASRFAKAEHVRPAMSITKNKKKHPHLSRFGFSFERGGVHTSRTMMLEELVGLLACVQRPEAEKSEYLQAIDHENCLGKRSGMFFARGKSSKLQRFFPSRGVGNFVTPLCASGSLSPGCSGRRIAAGNCGVQGGLLSPPSSARRRRFQPIC